MFDAGKQYTIEWVRFLEATVPKSKVAARRHLERIAAIKASAPKTWRTQKKRKK